MSIEIDKGVGELVVKATEARRATYRVGDGTGDPQLSIMWGRKFARIVAEPFGGQRSVYCFVDLTNGDILKATGWAGPAKGARGSVLQLDKMTFDADGGCFYRR